MEVYGLGLGLLDFLGFIGLLELYQNGSYWDIYKEVEGLGLRRQALGFRVLGFGCCIEVRLSGLCRC